VTVIIIIIIIMIMIATTTTTTTTTTSGQRILMKGRIAILSPLAAANGFVQP